MNTRGAELERAPAQATQALADSIRADEQKMLDRILKEIPKLTEAVARAGVIDASKRELARA